MNYETYIQKMTKLMEIKGTTEGSIQTYSLCLRKFFTHLGKEVDSITTEDIQEYLYELILSGYATNTVNHKHSILTFFFSKVLNKPYITYSIPYMKRGRHLPDVLTINEIESLLAASKNLKVKTILLVAYSSGLRVSEVASLKVADIDSKKMQLRVNQGKGKKDRYTILSQRALICLRMYYKVYRPNEWLFYPNSNKTKHLSKRTVQTHCKTTADVAGITKAISPHSLRHAFASHLLDDGVHIYAIKTLLGHSSLRSTQVYIQLSPSQVYSVKSPLDKVDSANE